MDSCSVANSSAIYVPKCLPISVSEVERLSTPVTKEKRRYTGFNLLSQEATTIFAAILDGKNHIKGFGNADIRRIIYPRSMQDNPRLVGKTTRLLAKLRAHGLIAKIPRSFRYRSTQKVFESCRPYFE